MSITDKIEKIASAIIFTSIAIMAFAFSIGAILLIVMLFQKL